MAVTLSRKDLEDLMCGAEILGCGGGGTVRNSSKLLDEMTRSPKMAGVEEVPEERLVFIAGNVGGGVSKSTSKRLEHYTKDSEKNSSTASLLRATELLSREVDQDPFGFIPTEIGAGNMMLPILISALADKYVIDGDCCGRAKPEISISTTAIAGVRVTPMCLVSPFGDEIVIHSTVDDQRAEDLARTFAAASNGSVACARAPMNGDDLRGAAIPGSIISSIELGRSVRLAKQRGKDVVDSIAEKSKSKYIFEGVIKSWARAESGAFMKGRILLHGAGRWKGHNLRVDYKNEYLVSFLDGAPYVTCPDLIMLLDRETGAPFSNWGNVHDFEGRKVVVLGRSAHPKWLSERGLEIFSPKHFGYRFSYKPLSGVVR